MTTVNECTDEECFVDTSEDRSEKQKGRHFYEKKIFKYFACGSDNRSIG